MVSINENARLAVAERKPQKCETEKFSIYSLFVSRESPSRQKADPETGVN